MTNFTYCRSRNLTPPQGVWGRGNALIYDNCCYKWCIDTAEVIRATRLHLVVSVAAKHEKSSRSQWPVKSPFLTSLSENCECKGVESQTECRLLHACLDKVWINIGIGCLATPHHTSQEDDM